MGAGRRDWSTKSSLPAFVGIGHTGPSRARKKFWDLSIYFFSPLFGVARYGRAWRTKWHKCKSNAMNAKRANEVGHTSCINMYHNKPNQTKPSRFFLDDLFCFQESHSLKTRKTGERGNPKIASRRGPLTSKCPKSGVEWRNPSKSMVQGNFPSPSEGHWFWSNYSDLTRPHPKWWFSKGIPLISGKSRFVKYYNLARLVRTC